MLLLGWFLKKETCRLFLQNKLNLGIYNNWQQKSFRSENVAQTHSSPLNIFVLQHWDLPMSRSWVLCSENHEVQIQAGRRKRCRTKQIYEQRTSSTDEHIRRDHHLTWRGCPRWQTWDLKPCTLTFRWWELLIASKKASLVWSMEGQKDAPMSHTELPLKPNVSAVRQEKTSIKNNRLHTHSLMVKYPVGLFYWNKVICLCRVQFISQTVFPRSKVNTITCLIGMVLKNSIARETPETRKHVRRHISHCMRRALTI